MVMWPDGCSVSDPMIVSSIHRPSQGPSFHITPVYLAVNKESVADEAVTFRILL